jgi:sulfur-oxidizing protein SoxX
MVSCEERRTTLISALRVAVIAIAASFEANSLRAGDSTITYQVAGDAIPAPLTTTAGDAERGRAIVRDRATGNCLICHRAPEPTERFMGDLGPDLSGVGARLTPPQIRLRLVDQGRLNPATLMPPYHRVAGLTRVAPLYRGRPILDAQQIEDVVAYLATLRESPPAITGRPTPPGKER